MRLLSYRSNQEWRAGIQLGDDVVDAATLTTALDRPAEVRTTRDVLELGAAALAQLASIASSAPPVGRVDELELGPPVPDPQKIICLGLNYRDHANEARLPTPSEPMFFAKFPNSLAGPTATIVPPATTTKVDYEAELAVVIGRGGRDIPPAAALNHVAGAMAFNDVSARDLQMANPLWTGGKAIDTFAPCGPALVTLDELGDLGTLGLRTRVNGILVQDGNTASMIFGVAETISFLSQIMTLEVGDIIVTGTPAGVGASRTPPLFLNLGDVVEVEVDGIGTLRNPVGARRPSARPSAQTAALDQAGHHLPMRDRRDGRRNRVDVQAEDPAA
jgi:2-keto-4-pentenoate hydratase/2-oxohepta-3-ene-1,7-dioic acid hydratase in catechol pathway